MKFIGISCSMDEKKYFIDVDYIKKITELGFCPLIITPDMTKIKENLVNIMAGFIISGGGDINPKLYGEENIASRNIVPDQRVEWEFELLETILSSKKPILGICYGMQLLNVFFGGSLIQNINTKINHTEGSHEIEIFKDFPLATIKATVNTSHHQAIKTLGKDLEVFCKAEDEIIEGIYLKNHPFCVGVQWHPERDRGEISLQLWKKFLKSLK